MWSNLWWNIQVFQISSFYLKAQFVRGNKYCQLFSLKCPASFIFEKISPKYPSLNIHYMSASFLVKIIFTKKVTNSGTQLHQCFSFVPPLLGYAVESSMFSKCEQTSSISITWELFQTYKLLSPIPDLLHQKL